MEKIGNEGMRAETGTSPSYRECCLALERQLEWRGDSGEGVK